MRYLKIIVGVLVIIVGVVFVLQNHDLQRPIKLGFDPLYMFRSHQAPPAPPAPTVEKEAPADGEAATDTQGESATTPQTTGEGSAAPETPAPPEAQAQPAEDDSSGIPVFILIFIAFFAGILVASLFGIMEKYRLKRVVKKGVARVKELEVELKKLRNLPLTQPTTQPILAPPPTTAEPFDNGTETFPPEGGEAEKDK